MWRYRRCAALREYTALGLIFANMHDEAVRDGTAVRRPQGGKERVFLFAEGNLPAAEQGGAGGGVGAQPPLPLPAAHGNEQRAAKQWAVQRASGIGKRPAVGNPPPREGWRRERIGIIQADIRRGQIVRRCRHANGKTCILQPQGQQPGAGRLPR